MYLSRKYFQNSYTMLHLIKIVYFGYLPKFFVCIYDTYQRPFTQNRMLTEFTRKNFLDRIMINHKLDIISTSENKKP